MLKRVFLCAMMILFAGRAGVCSPVATQRVNAGITLYPSGSLGPLQATLFGTNVLPGDKVRAQKPDFQADVIKMGIKSCRFPNGCVADLYNWKSVPPNQMTVDDFLDFCTTIAAEPYYTINMQGGTEGLSGPVPSDASVDERIKYQHSAPNPCGNTNYHFGTLAETLELVQKFTIDRALAGKQPLTCFEMGNENWGQSTTDWPPGVYAKTVEVYARAMRELVDKARRDHPDELAKVKLYLVAVGYPIMGNNMKLVDSPDRKINLAWTSGLNALHDQKLIDAVQEHFYPYGSADGGTLAWAVHNLHNIIYARKGKPNHRLNGYADPQLAYDMPMEHTEWNVKCWGTYYKTVDLTNPGFEDGLIGWKADDSASVSDKAARRGKNGITLAPAAGKTSRLSRTIDVPEGAKSFSFTGWVRTATKGAVRLEMKQANDGEHAGQTLATFEPRLLDMWEKCSVGAKPFADTKQVEVSVAVDGPASALVDEAGFRYTTEERGQVPPSAQTFEQELFVVDALREMALGGCPRAHIHHLSGDYPCGQTTGAGAIKDLGKAFEFFAGAYGDTLVRAECTTPSFGFYSQASSYATDFNAIAPDRDDIPMLGCMASRQGRLLHILLINRTSDRDISVRIDLGAEPAEDTADLRTLSGEDIDLPGATLDRSTMPVSRVFSQTVHPYSAQIISVPIEE